MIPLLLAQFLFLRATGIEVAVRPDKGAEVASLRVLHDGKWVETLYRGMDYSEKPGWTGKAPWLWPATGKGDPLPFHGFARDLPWKVEKSSATAVTLSLSDSPETRARQYPYGFRLVVDYSVAPWRLDIRFRVTAAPSNTDAMPFTAGNHITFNAPLLEGTDPLKMTFESPSSLEWIKESGSPNGQKRPRTFRGEPLQDFERDNAVSLGGYRGDPYIVYGDPGGLSMRISQHASSVPPDPVVRFNVWGDVTRGYFSPEPWVGLQDSQRLNKGITRLKPGETWHWSIRVEARSKPR